MMRGSGILLHISSLPNRYGIGSLGKEAYNFIDFLKKSGQKFWQVLPIGPTSYGDSPYQTFSAFAGNPYFIDLDILCSEKLLKKQEYVHLRCNMNQVDYAFQYHHRFQVLKIAFKRFLNQTSDEDYFRFLEANKKWLEDYALFMAIKYQQLEGNWASWEEPYKVREPNAIMSFKNKNKNEICFWKFLQYKFFEQWKALKQYANENNISIIGDMPIYVAYDSSDVWANPTYWQLDADLNPVSVAGVPPDLFSATGQLWGNPLYKYDLMEQEGFAWWINRIEESLKLFDIVRIDHFRGFEAYYSIPFSHKTAEFGQWIKGPGYKLFSKIKEALGDVKIIAEDLGYLTPEVYDLLDKCNFPGMKILQFGFSPYANSEYIPHNYSKNTVCYPGTHDNSTLKGWIKSLNLDELSYLKAYLGIKKENEIVEKAIKECLKSVSDITIIPLQDYLELDDSARFNIPSILGGNWIWRIKTRVLTEKLASKINSWAKLYCR